MTCVEVASQQRHKLQFLAISLELKNWHPNAMCICTLWFRTGNQVCKLLLSKQKLYTHSNLEDMNPLYLYYSEKNHHFYPWITFMNNAIIYGFILQNHLLCKSIVQEGKCCKWNCNTLLKSVVKLLWECSWNLKKNIFMFLPPSQHFYIIWIFKCT